MGVFQDVSNWLSGSYKVRTTKLSDNAQLQHVRLDVGSGTTESVVVGGLPTLTGLSIPPHDEIVLGYTGADLTSVTYKLATVTVATLTLSYTGADLTGVVKS